MRKDHLIPFLIAFTLMSSAALAQQTQREIGIRELDSLIHAKIDVNKIDEVGKKAADNGKTDAATKGGASRTNMTEQNPCDDDYDNLVMLFKSLKSNYLACCNGKSNYLAQARILASIYAILNNPDCKWGASQWLVFGYYLNEYSSFVNKYNCCQKQ